MKRLLEQNKEVLLPLTETFGIRDDLLLLYTSEDVKQNYIIKVKVYSEHTMTLCQHVI